MVGEGLLEARKRQGLLVTTGTTAPRSGTLLTLHTVSSIDEVLATLAPGTWQTSARDT